MIVRQFLQWVRSAPAGERAEATSALARAYLYSDLSEDDRAAAEGAMIMLLDDSSPLVRLALAEALASSPDAPPAVIHGLATDQQDIATIVLQRSPQFIDADLVEIVATAAPAVQIAIAQRAPLRCAVGAAIAEVGEAEACLALLQNPDAELTTASIDRVIERYGHMAAIRDALSAFDLPARTRLALVARVSESLAAFAAGNAWIDDGRAVRMAQEACEKAAIIIAGDVPGDARELIQHLRASGQLTVGLMLRALLSGNVAMFEEALSELSGVPLARVNSLVNGKATTAFRALFDKAGLPASTYPAFREAVSALNDARFADPLHQRGRLRRRLVERVLAGCERSELGRAEPLLMLLRRFATEAAREEARLYCEELIAGDAPRLETGIERIAA
jgi:uncharacterized protein (DUF2336 family)